jgi:hypothetical protein
VFFICDECREFATAGQNDPDGDEEFLVLSREPRRIRGITTVASARSTTRCPGQPDDDAGERAVDAKAIVPQNDNQIKRHQKQVGGNSLI